jgi:hypothetical protein
MSFSKKKRADSFRAASFRHGCVSLLPSNFETIFVAGHSGCDCLDWGFPSSDHQRADSGRHLVYHCDLRTALPRPHHQAL